MSTESSIEPRIIAGFWPRLGAFILDMIVLGIIGILIGTVFSTQLVKLGAWGRLLGFTIALVYFGIFNSSSAGGQTLGKRLVKIKTVSGDGSLLSVPKSFLRFIPLGVPYFLNNAMFSESILFSFWGYVLSIAIFGIGFSIIYLYCFNRKSRQSIHDLLVGSYVVKSGSEGVIAGTALWPFHAIVCGVLILASGILPYFTKSLVTREPFTGLLNVYRAVNAQSWVNHSQINRGKTVTATLGKGQNEVSFLSITAYTLDGEIDNTERAKQLAKLALATDESAKSLDVIEVTLAYGYDIGIASSWRSRRSSFSPQNLDQ